MSEKKCKRTWHDSFFFGENYDDCAQCSVRDNGPWDENPFLMPQWQVWYCPELDEITLWEKVSKPFEYFEAEHIETEINVQMFYIGDL